MGMDTRDKQEKTVRVQFECPESLYLRAKRYFKDDKYKGFFGLQAFETRVNYLEGRDKKLQNERIVSDAAYIQELIDSGEVKIPRRTEGK